MHEEQCRAALDAAAKQLSYRALSTQLLRDKLLEKGHSEDAVEYALAWLTERRLLDDAAYAESVVRGYKRRGYGAMRIRQELTRRGVDRETAEAAMQSFSADREQLCSLLDKRLHDVSDRRRSTKPVAALRQREVLVGEIATRSRPTAAACRRKRDHKAAAHGSARPLLKKTARWAVLFNVVILRLRSGR